MNNRHLLIIFITCLSLLLAGKFIKSKRSASFNPVLIAADTARIDHLKFISAGPEKEEFDLKRAGEVWEATQGQGKVTVQPSALKAILASFADLNANRVVTKDKAKYPEYEIDDAKAAQVMVWQNGKQVADLRIGGFRFDKVARTASAYVRKSDEPEVYLIDGFAGIGFKAKFDQFRDKKLVKTDAADLTSLEWVNASGNKQKIQKEDGAWYYAGMEALDSTKFNSYLAGLVNAQGSSFSELSSAQGLTLAEKLTLYGNNMSEPTILSAFISQDKLSPFLIHSSANRESIFHSDSSGLYKMIFTDLRQFWPDGQ